MDKDGVYDDALNWAIKEESVKNIALTGIYGSGKSSILKKFQQNNKDYEDYHFLEISLANFEWEIFEKETKRINENDEQQNIGGSNFSNIDKSNNQQSIDFHNLFSEKPVMPPSGKGCRKPRLFPLILPNHELYNRIPPHYFEGILNFSV